MNRCAAHGEKAEGQSGSNMAWKSIERAAQEEEIEDEDEENGAQDALSAR